MTALGLPVRLSLKNLDYSVPPPQVERRWFLRTQTGVWNRDGGEDALTSWLARQGSLATALSHPRLPASMRGSVQAAWDKLQAAAPTGGAAPSGGAPAGAAPGGGAAAGAAGGGALLIVDPRDYPAFDPEGGGPFFA